MKRLFSFIKASNMDSFEEDINKALNDGFSLYGEIFEKDWNLYQAIVSNEITWITIDTIKNCKNTGAVAVSWTITVNEW